MAAHTYRTWLWSSRRLRDLERAVVRRPSRGSATRCSSRRSRRCVGHAARRRGRGASSPVGAVRRCSRAGARRRPTAAALAAWLFLGGVMTNVVIGRMPFMLGIALAVAAWACARRSRVAAARARRSRACGRARSRASSSPSRRSRRRGAAARRRRRDAAAGAPRSRSARRRSSAGCSWRAVPRGRRDHFAATAFWPMLLVCLGGVALLDPRGAPDAVGRRPAVPGACSSPRSRSRTRSGRTRCGSGVRARAVGARRSRTRRACRALAVASVGVALLYLQWLPAVRAVGRGARRPVDAGSPSTPRCCDFLARARQARRALEVPLTRNHWEAADLARGRSRSRAAGTASSTARSTRSSTTSDAADARALPRWLRENAVRWVALPNAPLDFSATAERRCCSSGAAATSSSVYDVGATGASGRCAAPMPPASGAAQPARRRRRTGSIEATRPGRRVVRQHATRRTGPSRPATAACPRTRRAGRWSTASRAAAGARALLGARRAAARAALRAATTRRRA